MTKQNSAKKSAFPLDEGKAFNEGRLRQGILQEMSSVKRSGRYSELLEPETSVFLRSGPSQISALKISPHLDLVAFHPRPQIVSDFFLGRKSPAAPTHTEIASDSP